ncbi:hypothetical protein HDU76_011282 [Blyttiomyces sp. JEL0837]|nr:hypothetical protein HDU76_011282 [Blyttiomyces sp. JEL0837]
MTVDDEERVYGDTVLYSDKRILPAKYPRIKIRKNADIPDFVSISGVQVQPTRNPDDEEQDGSISRVRPLSHMASDVVAQFIDVVESLEGVPWTYGEIIRNAVVQMFRKNTASVTDSYLEVFFNAYPEEYARTNAHLVLRNLRIEGDVYSKLRSEFSRFIKLLDLHKTAITNDGLRTLARPIIHTLDTSLGRSTSGVISLSHLNVSYCLGIQDRDLHDILSRFPSLVAIELAGTSIKMQGAVKRLVALGWTRVSGEVNLFPGFRGKGEEAAVPAPKPSDEEGGEGGEEAPNVDEDLHRQPQGLTAAMFRLYGLPVPSFYRDDVAQTKRKKMIEDSEKLAEKLDEEQSRNAIVSMADSELETAIWKGRSLYFKCQHVNRFLGDYPMDMDMDGGVCNCEADCFISPENDMRLFIMQELESIIDRGHNLNDWHLPVRAEDYENEDCTPKVEVIQGVVAKAGEWRLGLVRSKPMVPRSLKVEEAQQTLSSSPSSTPTSASASTFKSRVVISPKRTFSLPPQIVPTKRRMCEDDSPNSVQKLEQVAKELFAPTGVLSPLEPHRVNKVPKGLLGLLKRKQK